MTPLQMLRHRVSGAIERGEAEPIHGIPAPDTSHLVALHNRLAHERERLASARNDSERALRLVYVAQCERELAGEFAFLGMSDAPADSAALQAMSDDELLRESLA